MGLGISIPIYVAKMYQSKTSQAVVITTGFFWWVLVTLFLSLLNMLLPGKITYFILGKGYEYLSWSVLFGFSSLYLYTILYATYRGEQNFGKANILQVISAGILPLIALYFSNGIVELYFQLYSLFMLTVNIAVLGDLYKRKLIIKISTNELLSSSKQFIKFGLPRVPGEFALFGLMSCPLFFIAKYDSLEMAGYVAIGFTLVQLVASFFEFIGILMLPKSAQLIADQQYFRINQLVRKLTLFSFIAASLISSIMYFNLDFILGLLDKSKFLSHLEYTKIIIICIPFYIIYLIIRNPQDALSIKPFNTFNLTFCFLVQLIFLFISINTDLTKKILLYHLAIIIPFVLLGILTFITWDTQISKRIV